ncbi:hypothetical protein SELMODRAFT_407107 [Selaginella moellendorffii]|uniref:Origin recognition complex subunit 4 C-terminal domain-containing protein n=1 Tax=Selaginella moellendorffii TaxID=88036 RepID=D8R3Y0_SELML|nr:hypothetical protein SELMODRAFT_407107 [Selaginella moellendorffii]
MALLDAAMQILRCRLYDPRASPVFASAEENRRKLYDLFRHTICQACNNSALLLGPRGCGKSMVRLNGLLHADDRSALKEIAKQLCVEHELEFSKAASFEENLRFLTVILEYVPLLRDQETKAVPSVQLVGSVAIALFPSSCNWFLETVLVIPVDSSANLAQHANAFNAKISAWLQMETTKELVNKLAALDSSPRNIIDSVFRNLLDYLKNTKSTTPKHPPTICALADLSVLELFLLTSMKRLENKERDTYTFNSVFKEYQDGYKSSDSYSKKAAYKAFEHLLERELIGYSDGKAVSSLSHLRPVKMLISFEELEQGLEASPVCPKLKDWENLQVIHALALA